MRVHSVIRTWRPSLKKTVPEAKAVNGLIRQLGLRGVMRRKLMCTMVLEIETSFVKTLETDSIVCSNLTNLEF